MLQRGSLDDSWTWKMLLRLRRRQNAKPEIPNLMVWKHDASNELNDSSYVGDRLLWLSIEHARRLA